MSQFDFANLAVQSNISEAEVNSISVSKQSAVLTWAQIEDKHPMEVEITEEHAQHAACDTSILTTSRIFNRMDLDAPVTSVSQSMFEPSRRLRSNAPPKRFYRTFWRSAAMRILKLSSMQNDTGRPVI